MLHHKFNSAYGGHCRGVAVKLVLFIARQTDVKKQHSSVFSLLYNFPRELSVVCIREYSCIQRVWRFVNMACFVLIPLKWPVLLVLLGCVEPFVKGHKRLHTCTLLNVWDFNCRLVHYACMTHAIPWTNTPLEWSCFRLVWLTAAAHSETAPVNGDVNSGSKSDESSHERQSILPSHPVVVFVVDWIAQCLQDIWSLCHKLSLEVFILSYQGLFL